MSRSWTDPDFADLVRRADRRRARRLRHSAAGAGPVAVVVAAALLMSGPSSPQAVTAAGGDESPSPSASASPGLPLPTAVPTAVPTDTLPPILGSPSPKPTPTGTETPSPKPTPTETTPPSVPDEPAAYVYLPGAAPADCARGANEPPVTNDADDRYWCWRYTGPTELRNGEETGLPFQVCRADTLLPGDGVLHAQNPSGGGSWVKADLSADGHFWNWWATSEPTAPVIAVAAGDCVQWTIPWPGTDEYGERLPPGDYVLHQVFIVQEIFQDRDASRIPVRVTG